MSEDDRFTWKTVHGWHTNAFLVAMNGLDKKNKRLKQEKEQLMQDWIRVLLSAKNEQKKLKDENEQLKQQLKEKADRIIKLEQYVYTKLCPKSENYDEKVLSKILAAILGDVDG